MESVVTSWKSVSCVVRGRYQCLTAAVRNQDSAVGQSTEASTAEVQTADESFSAQCVLCIRTLRNCAAGELLQFALRARLCLDNSALHASSCHAACAKRSQQERALSDGRLHEGETDPEKKFRLANSELEQRVAKLMIHVFMDAKRGTLSAW